MLGFGPLDVYPLEDDSPQPLPKAITLPPVAFGFASQIPGTRFGKNINLVAAAVTFNPLAIGTIPGKNINLVGVAINLGAPNLRVSPGKLFGLPPISLTYDYGTLGATTGKIFNLADEFSRNNTAGCLAEGALGEFVMGEGAQTTVAYSLPVRLFVAIPPTSIFPGKNLPLPNVSISGLFPKPEVDARRRKLRVSSIAS